MASLADLEVRRGELRDEIKAIDEAHENERFPEEVLSRWNDISKELKELDATIEELEARKATLITLSKDQDKTDREPVYARGKRVASHVPDDPTALEQYRTMTSNYDDLMQAYRDGAMKIIEEQRFLHPEMSQEKAQDNVARLLDTVDLARGDDGERSLARRVIATSSKGYQREWTRYIKSGTVGREMERAASLSSGSGGYAVPVVLDPTVILVSSGVLNPIRQIARVESFVGNTYEFITSTGITASYGNEATEASDGAPALVQPIAYAEKAQAFVPMSIEIAEDWGAVQSAMGVMFSDAKDTLENVQFLQGLGHASHAPQGLIAAGGATAVVSTATTAVVAAADLYSLEAALAPRWQARATFVGNRAVFQKIRQFDTAGGASLWVQLQNSNPPTLLGYDAHIWSSYSSATTTSGSTVLTLGDFSQFLIADRVGMNVEFIPHLFGGSNRYPTGQRGLYCYWRNTSLPLTPALQANSAFVSLKVL